MEESIKMDKIKLITMSPLVLAYLGDTVYESYIREHLIRQNINRNNTWIRRWADWRRDEDF